MGFMVPAVLLAPVLTLDASYEDNKHYLYVSAVWGQHTGRHRRSSQHTECRTDNDVRLMNDANEKQLFCTLPASKPIIQPHN